ncbi:MAG: helix-turn-helix domain-containing protein [Arenicella sp.]
MYAKVKCIDEIETEHVHDFHQIVLGLNGYVDFRIEEDSGAVSSALGCVIPATIRHQFIGHKDSSVLVIDVDRNDSCLLGKQSAFNKPESMLHQTRIELTDVEGRHKGSVQQEGYTNHWRSQYYNSDSFLQSDTEKLFEEHRYFEINGNFRRLYTCCAKELSRFPNEQMIQSVCKMILCSVSARISDLKNQNRPHHRIDIDKLRHWVSLNLTEKITVASMAEIMCMSTSHFHTCFLSSTRKTPHQFVVEIRLQHALEKVRNTTSSFACIADETGFSSQSAMTNTFRKHLGYSPLQLRKGYTQILM